MSVLVPRQRTLGVRLSDEEYAALEKFCIDSGARSVSDLARTAIWSFVNRATEEGAQASTAAQLKELEQKVERLSADFATFKVSSPEARDDEGKESKGDLDHPELLPQLAPPAPVKLEDAEDGRVAEVEENCTTRES